MEKDKQGISISIGSAIELKESGKRGTLWNAYIIGEGLGLNSQKGKDGKFYRENFTKESIEALTPLLEGVRVKAYEFLNGKHDHLPQDIETVYKGKVVNTNVGILEDPACEIIDGKAHAKAKLRLSDNADWLRSLLVWAHDNGHPDYLGLSINSQGSARARITESGDRFMDIVSIDEPNSVDVVDKPAARGRVETQFYEILQSEQHNSGDTTSNSVNVDVAISDNSDDVVVSDVGSDKESDKEITSIEISASNSTSEKTAEEKHVEERTSNDAFLDLHVSQPMRTFLDGEGILYREGTARSILESIDKEGLSYSNKAVIELLSKYVEKSKVNSAVSLLKEAAETQSDRSLEKTDGVVESTITVEPNEVKDPAACEADPEPLEGCNMEKLIKDENKGQETVNSDASGNGAVEGSTVVESEGSADAVSTVEVDVVESGSSTSPDSVKGTGVDAVASVATEITKLTQAMQGFMSGQESRMSEIEQRVLKISESATKVDSLETREGEMLKIWSEIRKQNELEKIERILESSGLYPETIDKIKAGLKGRIPETTELEEIISREKEMFTKLRQSSSSLDGNVSGLGYVGYDIVRVGDNASDKIQVAMNKLFDCKITESDDSNLYGDSSITFGGLRDAYTKVTGDVGVTGYMNKRFIREGIIGHDTFAETLSNTMNRYLVEWYRSFDHAWRDIVRYRRGGLTDYRPYLMNALGGFGNLPIFKDNAAAPSADGYADAAQPVERQGSYQAEIRAKMVTVTEKMIKNDDLNVVTRMLEELAFAAEETLMEFVFSILVGASANLIANGTTVGAVNTDSIYGGSNARALFAAGNSGTAALDYDSLKAAIMNIRMAKKIGNSKPLRLHGTKYLVVPEELRYKAMELHPDFTPQAPTESGDQKNEANVLPDYKIISVDKIYLGNDANNWYLVEEPNRFHGIEIGFIDNEENPRIILQSDPTVGRTFTHGGFRFNISHRYGGGIAGHEGLYASIVVNP
ncbi:MAG: hypothetical protein GY861_22620 [bacterium]|nr:hypothetical protein [bacterium]